MSPAFRAALCCIVFSIGGVAFSANGHQYIGIACVALAVVCLVFMVFFADPEPFDCPDDPNEWDAKRADASHPSESLKIFGGVNANSVDAPENREYLEYQALSDSIESAARAPIMLDDDDDSNAKLVAALSRFNGRVEER